MELTKIIARDLPEAWFLLLKQTIEHGYSYIIDSGSFKGATRLENDIIALHIQYPGSRPFIPDVPIGIPSPTTNDYVENDYFPNYIFQNNPKPGQTYTYAQYIEPQLKRVIETLKTKGFNTNQTYIRIGDDITDASSDPACLRGIDIRVREGKVHFIVYFRSWDLWAGLPSNLAGLQLLKEYVACELNVEDGEMFAFSKGLHLYGYSLELAKKVIGK
jgi:thymidylate synthase